MQLIAHVDDVDARHRGRGGGYDGAVFGALRADALGQLEQAVGAALRMGVGLDVRRGAAEDDGGALEARKLDRG